MKILKELMKKKINIFSQSLALSNVNPGFCVLSKKHTSIYQKFLISSTWVKVQLTVFFSCFYFFKKIFMFFLSFISNDSLLIWKEYIAGYMAAFLDSIYQISKVESKFLQSEVYRDCLIDYLERIAKFFTLLFLGHFMFCYMKVIMKLNWLMLSAYEIVSDKLCKLLIIV